MYHLIFTTYKMLSIHKVSVDKEEFGTALAIHMNHIQKMWVSWTRYWWWGSNSWVLGSVEWPLCCYYYPGPLRPEMVLPVRVAFVGQIDLFEIILKYINTLALKILIFLYSKWLWRYIYVVWALLLSLDCSTCPWSILYYAVS